MTPRRSAPSAGRPWLALYAAGAAHEIEREHDDMLSAFRSTVQRRPDAVALTYFDGILTFADLDARSDAVATALQDNGFQAGDRLALYLQNVPAFVVGLLAAWKCGGAAVAVNPMNKRRELAYLLDDSGAVALLLLDELYDDVAAEVIASGETSVRIVITCSAFDEQTRDDERVLSRRTRPAGREAGVLELSTIYREFAGRAPDPAPAATPDQLAVLSYTSGTTGAPKGAMNTHGNLVFNAQTYRDWMSLGEDDSILAVAPLFHITGLVGHVCTGLLVGCPVILSFRFEPGVMLDAIREHRPTFTIGAITALMALIALDGGSRDDWSSFRLIYSGGAPIAPSVTDRFEAATGHYIHNFYGLTETNSPSHGVPPGVRAPVDPESGALSVGVPTFNTVVRVLDDNGEEVPAGEPGEFATRGPQVVPAYWQRPDATAESLPDGELRTGDVGFMTPEGWFFLIDRKKDMINASGYKVWPREVEDVLYSHPAVREAAVVGVPDEYRGETVKAVVSVVRGESVTPAELIAFCKERMAAYKYPRQVEVLEELPKTPTGKILRRELRAAATDTAKGAG